MTSSRPRDAARWSGVVRDEAGCTPLGEIARCARSSEIVSAVLLY